MKAFLLFIIFLVVAAFAWWEHTKIVALTAELDRLRAPRVTARPQPIQAPNYVRHIICPVCHGERKVAYDSGGRRDPLDKKMDGCPVCGTKGYRDITVLPGQKICPDCQGMGILASQEPQHPMRTGNCGRCSATGVVADVR